MYVLLKWDILHSVVGEWKSDPTLLLTSLSVYVTQVRVLECLPWQLALHFTDYLLTNSSSEVNIRAKWWCILPNRTYIFLNFGWKCWTSFCSHIKEDFENQVQLPLTYTLCVILPIHNFPHMSENSAIRPQEFSQWQFPFYCSYQEIFLMHTVRREIASYSWNKGVALGTLVTMQNTL
jgi:hypothetical protein